MFLTFPFRHGQSQPTIQTVSIDLTLKRGQFCPRTTSTLSSGEMTTFWTKIKFKLRPNRQSENCERGVLNFEQVAESSDWRARRRHSTCRKSPTIWTSRAATFAPSTILLRPKRARFCVGVRARRRFKSKYWPTLRNCQTVSQHDLTSSRWTREYFRHFRYALE